MRSNDGFLVLVGIPSVGSRFVSKKGGRDVARLLLTVRTLLRCTPAGWSRVFRERMRDKKKRRNAKQI